ncbi:MAG: hypothetical protein AAF772_20685 [Acidobacteriota bacterium]
MARRTRSQPTPSRDQPPTRRLIGVFDTWLDPDPNAPPARAATLAVALWGVLVHGLFLATSLLREAPVGLFLFGDALHYLATARAWAAGDALGAGLPFHPPLTSALLVPLAALFASPAALNLAAKLLMITLAALGYALTYRLIARRPALRALALPTALLLPLIFGELALVSAVSSEIPYRLWLLILLGLGWRRPWLAGGVHGLALLTRAEHLPIALVLGAVIAWRAPAHRPQLVRTGAAALLVLLPYLLVAGLAMRDYNARHADRMAEPLPTLVPVSFYGPLNFALAWREPDIVFSRRTLPPLPASHLAAAAAAGQPVDANALDPTYPPHHAVIVDGYALGLRAIADAPGEAVGRAFARAGHAMQVFAYGVTGADLPGRGPWTRYPVDVAVASREAGAGLVQIAWLLLIALGAWRLARGPDAARDRMALVAIALLVVYRLAMDVVFFPYLRGMLIALPAFVLLAAAGATVVFHRRTSRVLVAAALLLGLAHAALVLPSRDYRLAGERDAGGRILDDRTVTIERK